MHLFTPAVCLVTKTNFSLIKNTPKLYKIDKNLSLFKQQNQVSEMILKRSLNKSVAFYLNKCLGFFFNNFCS